MPPADDADDELSGISPELVLVDPELARRVREREAPLATSVLARPRRGAPLRLVAAPGVEPAIVPRPSPTEPPGAEKPEADAFVDARTTTGVEVIEHVVEAETPRAVDPPRHPIPPPLAEPPRRPILPPPAEWSPHARGAAEPAMPHPVKRTSTAPRPAASARRGRRVLALLGSVAAASLAMLTVLQLTGGPSETSHVAGPEAKDGLPQARQVPPVAGRGAPTPKITTPTTSASTRPVGLRPATRRLAWAPVAGAVGYHVELFRGDERLLAQETKEPALELGRSWRHQRRTVTLTPGTYRWYVWAVTKNGRAAQAVVQAKLTV